MNKGTPPEITNADLFEMATRLRKFSEGLIKVQVRTRKQDILRICKDEPTHKNIDFINSASIYVKGIRFELIKVEYP